MEALIKYLEKVKDGVDELIGDIERIKINKNEKDENKKKPMKSMQPVTKFYSSKQEIIEAKENPDADFIKGQVEKIFKW